MGLLLSLCLALATWRLRHYSELRQHLSNVDVSAGASAILPPSSVITATARTCAGLFVGGIPFRLPELVPVHTISPTAWFPDTTLFSITPRASGNAERQPLPGEVTPHPVDRGAQVIRSLWAAARRTSSAARSRLFAMDSILARICSCGAAGREFPELLTRARGSTSMSRENLEEGNQENDLSFRL